MGRRYNLTKPACELLEAGCEDDLIASVTRQSPAMVLHYAESTAENQGCLSTAKANRIKTVYSGGRQTVPFDRLSHCFYCRP